MTRNYLSDFHCHLNGSFSLEFLKARAERNDCVAIYRRLEKIRAHYLTLTKEQPKQGYPEQLLQLVWQQFSLIHLIIKTLDDIEHGVVDVARHTPAKYIEIRTSPKRMGQSSLDDYINAFERGLHYVNADITLGTKACGLLSLDRSTITVPKAKHLIDSVYANVQGPIRGIDISGNPLAKRELTGQSLQQVLCHALERSIGIAIHMGETDSIQERKDTDTVLALLETWCEKSYDKQDYIRCKVRLGHCIYLTDEQKNRIKALQLPIEVCPTCHNKLNWHINNTPHPVTKIYSSWGEPILIGTDDNTVFGSNALDEFNNALPFFKNPNKLTPLEIQKLQIKYRFGNEQILIDSIIEQSVDTIC
jgi:adenosine deaminase